MIVNVLAQALEYVGAREPVLLHLLHYLLVHFKVIVVFVERVKRIMLESALSRAALSDQVLIQYIVLSDLFFLECCLFILAFLLFFGRLIALTLIVGVLVVDAIVKVLIIEFFILSVEFPDPRVEPDRHVLVNEHRLDLLVDGLGLGARLGVEGTKDD